MTSVIALSGIGAHAFGSFKSRGKPHMWLRDDLPKDLPGSRVMIWGYESTISKSKDTKSIQDMSRQLRHDLSQISESVRSRPFIFVAHSLGGLVLKKVCLKRPTLLMSSHVEEKLAELTSDTPLSPGTTFFSRRRLLNLFCIDQH